MNDQDADRIRDAIQRDQTSCRCGHLLAACADCRGWLVDHSRRIESSWRWFVNRALERPGWVAAGQDMVDEVEAYYLAYYESQR